jgi:hypothetical protein
MSNKTWISIYEKLLRIIHGYYLNNPIFIQNIEAKKKYLFFSELPCLSVKQLLTYRIILSNMESKLIRIVCLLKHASVLF